MCVYNLNFLFDEKLKDFFEKPSDVHRYIEEEIKQLKKTSDMLERVKMLGLIGVHFRILEDLDRSKKYLQEAIQLIRENNLGLKLQVVNEMRLAHTYQWERNFELSKEIFEKLEKICELESDVVCYRHFLFQHFGKYYFDLKEYKRALYYFKNALLLRKNDGEQSLIESSQFAIEITEKKLNDK